MSEPTDEQVRIAARAIEAAVNDFAADHISVLGIRAGVVDHDGVVRLTFEDAARIALRSRPDTREPE